MSLKVLIIEDEGIVGIYIKRTILSMGHEVLMVVKNADDALEIAQTNKVDLVISDININGDMDGIECCRILQDKYNTPVIFITAYRDTDTLKKASNIDFVGYLVKPFREDELETVVNLAIFKHELLNVKDRYVICDNYSYCHRNDELLFKNKTIILTKKENTFLQTLIRAKCSVVSYNTIDYDVWNNEIVGESTRRQLVHRFKQKVPKFPIELIKGVGYKLVCHDKS